MQIDGYSLDAQRARMKAYADFNDYEIVGEYEDAGKSGKSIEGRLQFNQMMLIQILDQMEFQNIWKITVFVRYSDRMGNPLYLMPT